MNNMLIALEITALGMGLVFAAIIVLWGMMNLLTSLAADKHSSPDSTVSSSGATPVIPDESERKAQAAAAAVTLALARHQSSSAHALIDPPDVIVSAWQLGMRTRQMYQKGNSSWRQARQDDK